jgi:hypothetical protein
MAGYHEEMSAATIPEVYIIETLDIADEEHRREGEVVRKVLSMAGKSPRYCYVRTAKELKYFAKDFGESGYRYLHISCHGNVGLFGTTFDRLSDVQFADIVGPHLDRRRLFLSTCLAATSEFAQLIFDRSSCFSVAGPVGKIDFTDAALFWSMFYHLMFRSNEHAMSKNRILENIGKAATCIDEKIRIIVPSSRGTTTEQVLP